MNEAYKLLVLVPNSAPHKYLIGKKKKEKKDIRPTDPKMKNKSDLRETQQLFFLPQN